jgi:GNAT superfamily N-acetyltransferase
LKAEALTYSITVTEAPSDQERAAITDPLIAFNLSHGAPDDYRLLVLAWKDSSGSTIGGLWGHTSCDRLHVVGLFVPEPMRGSGIGRELMLQAETIAQERGCIGAWLDTFQFQAPEFYEKLGYTIFGMLTDHPRGVTHYFMQKYFKV